MAGAWNYLVASTPIALAGMAERMDSAKLLLSFFIMVASGSSELLYGNSELPEKVFP